MSTSITVTGHASRTLNRLLSILHNRLPINRDIAKAMEVLTSAHLNQQALTRHDSARRLGATPTGHLERAAKSVTSDATADSATASVTSPGISRAGGPIVIRPVNGDWLTIPIHRLAYGKTAWEVSQAGRLFRPGPKGRKKKVLSRVVDGKLVNFFALSRRVRLKQDRTLFPSNKEYLRVAVTAASTFLRNQRLGAQGGGS